LPDNKLIQNITYLEQLGRLLQKVAVRASTNGNDIIIPVKYDFMGRQNRDFLPYVANQNNGGFDVYGLTNQFKYYKGEGYDPTKRIEKSYFAYSETVFENSPLNRVIEKGAPGEAWQPEHPAVYENISITTLNVRSINGYHGSTSWTIYVNEEKPVVEVTGTVTFIETFVDYKGIGDFGPNPGLFYNYYAPVPLTSVNCSGKIVYTLEEKNGSQTSIRQENFSYTNIRSFKFIYSAESGWKITKVEIYIDNASGMKDGKYVEGLDCYLNMNGKKELVEAGHGHTIIQYGGTNKSREIPRWEWSPDQRYCQFGSYYDVDKLIVQTTIDENGHKSYEYLDGDNVIAKKTYNNGIEIITYYVYDDYNRLRFVIPPAAIAALRYNGYKIMAQYPSAADENGLYTIPNISDYLKEWITAFEYDEQGRLIAKYLPEGGTQSSYSFSFDGVDDYVDIPYISKLNIQSCTIEFWLYLKSDPNVDSNNNWRWLISRNGWGNYHVILEQDKQLNWTVVIGGKKYRLWTNAKATIGEWVHFALTYDASTGKMEAYRNGVLTNYAVVPVKSPIDASTRPLRIGWPSGKFNPSGNGCPPVIMDEMRIINRALTAAEIQEDYNAGYNYPVRNGTVAWYRMDESTTGNIIMDASGNRINGTIHGATWALGINKNDNNGKKDDGITLTVYDLLGRAVMVQDAKLREKKLWVFTKYDQYGRSIYSGIVKYIGNRVQVQNLLDNQNVFFEKRKNNSIGYSLNNSLSFLKITEKNILQVTYYDDYDFNYDGIVNNSDLPGGNITKNYFGHEKFIRLYGKVTGGLSRIIDPDLILKMSMGQNYISQPVFLKSYSFYDKYGRVIYSYNQDHLNGYTIVESDYDFSGKLLKSRKRHYKNGVLDLIVQNRNEYDQLNRIKNMYQKVNNQSEVLIANYIYNDLGTLVEKNLYSEDGGNTFLQSVDYSYNIRGWMIRMNHENLIRDNIYNNDSEDLFGFRLVYHDVESYMSGLSPQMGLYNGNISAMIWKTKNSYQMGYGYQYDEINQIKRAKYGEYVDGGFSRNINKFNLDEVRYDLNGNIVLLKRQGAIYYSKSGPTKFGMMDQLNYRYRGNQLIEVDDLVPNISGNNRYDFSDAVIDERYEIEYIYDKNGNMVYDANKGITIRYNYLNLPYEVNFGNGNKIVWTYASDGSKLKKEVYQNGQKILTKDYVNGMVYVNNTLDFFSFSEGRCKMMSDGTYRYEYHLTDHLGNVRVAFTKGSDGKARIIQEKHYYPFGLEINGLSKNYDSDNKFAYNGKELEDEFGLNWYHYGARYYDPQVGRWWVVDPGEEYYCPYLFSANSPIVLRDVDGNFTVSDDGTSVQWIPIYQAKFSTYASICKYVAITNWIYYDLIRRDPSFRGASAIDYANFASSELYNGLVLSWLKKLSIEDKTTVLTTKIVGQAVSALVWMASVISLKLDQVFLDEQAIRFAEGLGLGMVVGWNFQVDPEIVKRYGGPGEKLKDNITRIFNNIKIFLKEKADSMKLNLNKAEDRDIFEFRLNSNFKIWAEEFYEQYEL
jgi:RHS repeat-associated protein